MPEVVQDGLERFGAVPDSDKSICVAPGASLGEIGPCVEGEDGPSRGGAVCLGGAPRGTVAPPLTKRGGLSPLVALSASKRGACFKRHKWPRGAVVGSSRPFEVRSGESVLEVCGMGEAGQVGHPGVRRPIREWSAKSRREAWKQVSAVPWRECSDLALITLTYPGNPIWVPFSGADAKRDLRAWIKRMGRAYGAVAGLWKQEFQRRGAVHFHIWMKGPRGWLNDLTSVRWRVAEEWFKVVQSGMVEHLYAGTSVERIETQRSDGRLPSHYFKSYISKRGRKEYQNQVPADFESPGRFWGFFGELGPAWSERVEVEAVHVVRLLRVMRKLVRSRSGRKYRLRQRAPVGMFVVCEPETVAELWRFLVSSG